jgi:dTDP-4-dehydrorhamnose reductase
MKILITGAGGHLGAALVRRFSHRHSLTVRTREELDVSRPSAVRDAVEAMRPDVILNGAAYTDVDGAEDEPVKALEVNALGVRSLAAAASRIGAVLVHYSTDFVFDGLTDRPYEEADAPNPRSIYACSKLIGEWFAEETPRHYVLRVESLFGAPRASKPGRRTSVDRIVDTILAGAEVSVFVDRTVSPSYTADVSAATEALLDGRPPGLYHCVNTGHCTFLELALEAARQARREPRLAPLTMEGLGLRADRPKYCAMSNARLASVGIPMPSWRDALARYVRERLAHA